MFLTRSFKTQTTDCKFTGCIFTDQYVAKYYPAKLLKKLTNITASVKKWTILYLVCITFNTPEIMLNLTPKNNTEI